MDQTKLLGVCAKFKASSNSVYVDFFALNLAPTRKNLVRPVLCNK